MTCSKPIFLILLTWSIFSCKTKDPYGSIITVNFEKTHHDQDTLHKFAKDSVTREVPELYKYSSIRRERKKIESALQVGALENGFTNRQFRILGNEYDEYEGGWTRLLVFKNETDWDAKVYYMRFAGDDGFLLTIHAVQYQKYSLGTPKLGWRTFVDSLTKMGLFSLPDCGDVPGYLYNQSTDEQSYDVEFASSKSYRIYGYFEPMERSDKFIQAKQLMNIISFIKAQFNLPRPLTPPQKKSKKDK